MQERCTGKKVTGQRGAHDERHWSASTVFASHLPHEAHKRLAPTLQVDELSLRDDHVDIRVLALALNEHQMWRMSCRSRAAG